MRAAGLQYVRDSLTCDDLERTSESKAVLAGDSDCLPSVHGDWQDGEQQEGVLLRPVVLQLEKEAQERDKVRGKAD